MFSKLRLDQIFYFISTSTPCTIVKKLFGNYFYKTSYFKGKTYPQKGKNFNKKLIYTFYDVFEYVTVLMLYSK